MTNHNNILSVFAQSNLRGNHTFHPTVAENKLPEILFITSYPPRECGIATYSQDLIKALNNKFNRSFLINICALESENERHSYSDEVKYILNTNHPQAFSSLSKTINGNVNIGIVLVQHEFGFYRQNEAEFQSFLEALTVPIIFVFHTVLPHPTESLKENVRQFASISESIIVMTRASEKVLINDYGVPAQKIAVIPHGTHLVPHSEKSLLKNKHNLSGKIILSTFGLLSAGKSIETTLKALPVIIKENPNVLFLIIGKTHPSVIKQEGEKYRFTLQALIDDLHVQEHVLFINHFLPLPDLLEYLQLTDIYLFTSRDPNQAVSGTFSYAISCGCPVISTPIPHAREVLQKDAGIIIDFENSTQLTDAVSNLLNNESLRKNISSNGLHKMASTAWENAAIAHAILFQKIGNGSILLDYAMPSINLDQIKKLTTDFGMIQFSKINQPDLDSGYTLDDNARALIGMCQHFELTKDEADIQYITIYLNFIKHCMCADGYFLNYVNDQRNFTEQNGETNLEDANGRAIWALGYLIYMTGLLPKELIEDAEVIMQQALPNAAKNHSTRAMAFIIKGLYYRNYWQLEVDETRLEGSFSSNEHPDSDHQDMSLIRELANRLVQMFRHEADNEWQWFESYLTYANSILPEALLCAWLITGESLYKEIARSSFDFLLTKTFTEGRIKVISNKSWLHHRKKNTLASSGEQPIDVAYTILALNKFYNAFKDDEYFRKMRTAFNWFLGNNHLHQIVYNPCTGGCYDGLEDTYINLNQGAESTISYLMARLTVDPEFRSKSRQTIKHQKLQYLKSIQVE